MTRLDALETAYLRAESDSAPLHVGAIAFFDSDPLCDDTGRFRIEDVRARIAGRLAAVPKLQQRVVEIPLEMARPVWADDASFDITNHVEAVAAPAPGDMAAVMTLLTKRYSEPLDRRRPMWHLLFVTGVEGDRVALLQRAHHSLVDGVGGVELASILLDLAPKPAGADAADGTSPTTRPSPPGGFELVRDALVDATLGLPKAVLAATSFATRHPLAAAAAVRTAVGAVRSAARAGVLAPASTLNAPTSARRQLSFVRGELDAFKRAGKNHDATVNDMVLSVVTTALREQLIARGEFVRSDAVLKALVPVSLRAATDQHGTGNHVAGLVVDLPIGLGDATERISAIAAATRYLKESHEDAATMALLDAANLLPPVALDFAGAVMRHQPLINLVVTNVPGPPMPLYALSSKMREVFPIVPIYGNLTLGVAVLSYDGALNFGVTSDPATCPDVDQFVGALRRAMKALAEDN